MPRILLYYVYTILSAIILDAQTSVAIVDFENQSDKLFLDSWEKKVPELLMSALSHQKDLALVDRTHLQTILDERALSLAGIADDSTGQSIGQLSAADFLITGSINRLNGKIRIDARIISSRTGKTQSEKVQGPKDALEKMIFVLANNLSFQLTGEGEHRDEMALKAYPSKLFLYTTLGFTGVTLIAHQQCQSHYDTYHGAVKLDNMNENYDHAKAWFNTRNIMISVTGATALVTLYCWIRNMNPEKIIASESTMVPYMYATNEKGMVFGLAIPF